MSLEKDLQLDRLLYKIRNRDKYKELSPEKIGSGQVIGQLTLLDPTLLAPTIVDFSNANHTHQTIAQGGTLSTLALTAGTLPVVRGGTGISGYTQGDMLYASAAGVLSQLAKDTNATRYLSNTGTSNNPAWAQIDLSNGVTGILIPNRTASPAGDYTVLVTDEIIAKTGITGGGDTVIVPSNAVVGQPFHIQDESGTAGTNNITIATAGSELINGAATAVVNGNYDSITVYFNGTDYFIKL